MHIEKFPGLCVLLVIATTMFTCSQKEGKQSLPLQNNPSPEPRAVIAERSPSTNQPIRLVDFANFRYQWVSNLGDTKQSFALEHGEYAGSERDVPMSIRSIAYGDVTGDGIDEAMVVLSVVVSGGTARPHVVYVYTLHNKDPKLLWAFSAGDRADGGLRQVYAASGELVVELYGKGRIVGRESNNIEDQLGVCCPKFFTRAHYQWRDKGFLLKGEEVIVPQSESSGSPIMPSYRPSF